MKLDDVRELHFIALIQVAPLVLRHGILSRNQVKHLRLPEIANPLVQKRRKNKTIPGGYNLHDYVNLYFHARNPMMCAIQHRREELCVLRVDKNVMQVEGVIIADGNASSDYTKFSNIALGLSGLDKNLVFIRDWRSSDRIEYYSQKRIRCAEVLVPQKVNPEYVLGVYVFSESAKNRLSDLAEKLSITIDPDLFTI